MASTTDSITPVAAARRVEAQLDCAPVTVVRLDHRGLITHVNESWRRFGHDNGADERTIAGVGLDYIAVARKADRDGGSVMASGLIELLDGKRDSFVCDYSCHSRTDLRWYRLEARRIAADEAVVLVHTDVTARTLAEGREGVHALVASALARRASMAEVYQAIARAIAANLEWDLAAAWMPEDAPTDGLRCQAVWTRPGADLAAAKAASLAAGTVPWTRLFVRPPAIGVPEWQDLGQGQAGLGRPQLEAVVAAELTTRLAVPIGDGETVFAALELYCRTRREADSELDGLLIGASGALALREAQRLAEAALATARAEEAATRGMLDSIVACSPVVLITLTGDGRISYVNRAQGMERASELAGADWLAFVPPERHEEHRERLARVLRTGVPETYDITAHSADGELQCIAAHLGPLRDGDRVVGAVLAAQDVTVLRRTQAEIAAGQRLAAISTLAAGVAHEINTPVRFVNGRAQFLREASEAVFRLLAALRKAGGQAPATDASPELDRALAAAAKLEADVDLPYLLENVPRAFERCADGLARITTIVRSMKEFAHPTRSDMAHVDLNRAIESTLVIARNEYRYVADLESELGELPEVRCIIGDVNQVVLNLVINAAHAIAEVVGGTEQKGKIRVTTRRDGDDAVIEVADTGCGIPDAIKHRIFEPFVTTKGIGRGTGQGLALAWSVVKEKHGGSLRFDSAVGQGTTFYLRLPIEGAR